MIQPRKIHRPGVVTHTPLITEFRRLRQMDHWVRGQPGQQTEFLYRQRYMEKACLEKTKRRRKTSLAKLPQESVAKIQIDSHTSKDLDLGGSVYSKWFNQEKSLKTKVTSSWVLVNFRRADHVVFCEQWVSLSLIENNSWTRGEIFKSFHFHIHIVTVLSWFIKLFLGERVSR